MRKAHTWTVRVQVPSGETTTEKVKAYWDPDHVLTTESVESQGRFQVRLRSKFKGEAAAIPGTVELVD